MGAQKKRAAAAAAAARVSEDPDDLARQPLQAILLADSFTTKFRPITLERPKVLTLSVCFISCVLSIVFAGLPTCFNSVKTNRLD